MALAIHYWVGDPVWPRSAFALALCAAILVLWFWPGPRRRVRWLAALSLIGVFVLAYTLKVPQPSSWVPLHERVAGVEFQGGTVRITDFRDAIHRVGEPAEVIWQDQIFDLSQLVGARIVFQPFGKSLATVHVLMAFEFADGNNLAVSVEARRTSWEKFDPLAGFFRHDQLYVVLGTERDVIWKRLARDPPYDLYIFEIARPIDEVRAYLEKVLVLAADLKRGPQFYSTVTDSCFTTLVKLSPRIGETVAWYDYRRWVPGAAIAMLQETGTLDDSKSEQELIEFGRLAGPVAPPWLFSTSADWNRHLRDRLRSDPETR